MIAHVMTSTLPRPVIENVQLFSTGSGDSHDPVVADRLQPAFCTLSGQPNVS